MTEKLIPYSEIFYSIQGEGPNTGVPTVWLRFFLCNLQCDGFGQDDPTNPDTYELPYKNIDVSRIKMIEDLPVFSKGCDSSYSWSAKFKHLQHRETASTIAEKLIALNPVNEWSEVVHVCFTGGEPLLKANQANVIAVLDELLKRIPEDQYLHITFETNGTQHLTEDMKAALEHQRLVVTFSVSPKLFSVSGEKAKDAIVPDAIFAYGFYAYNLYFKFVLSDKDSAWDELETVLETFREVFPVRRDWVWIMPVGADEEGQMKVKAKVADRALARGYRVSSRVHVDIWGNTIGK